MKITFVLPYLCATGGMRVLATYTKLLQQRGHQLFIVSTPAPPPTLMQKCRSLLAGQGWPSARKKDPSHFDNIDVECRVLNKFRPITDRDLPDADAIVATWWETAEWVAKVSPNKGAKVYFLQHYENFSYLPKGRVEATWSLPMHKIAVSQWLADIAANQYGDRNVSLVPPSVDNEQFYVEPQGQQRTKQPVPTVGMYYTITPWKGCDIALEAFALAAKKIPNLRLVAFGTGDPVTYLPLPANVEYEGAPTQDKLREFYNKCDVWLFASRSEGFGLPILEAMACGTPVIGTPAGAAPQLLASGGGILVNPEDPADMARAIEKVCHLSQAQWQAMSDAALKEIAAYTWEDAVDLFEAALYQAVERQDRSTDKTEKSANRQ
ncbi:MAG: glycosyltransferase family 4 protein [Richelia sp. CSU_2_1]|nr:glycosyltransferase family 4 protein [Richelia sp. CSU_2_1]